MNTGSYTIPVMTGFLFLGSAYGVYMNASGFPAIYPILMSLTIFAGSMEFVTVNLLLGAFNPVGALAGVSLSAVCLILFGSEGFVIPSMLAILGALTLLRRPLERREAGEAP